MDYAKSTKEYIVHRIKQIEIIFQDEIVKMSDVCVKEYLEKENIIRLKINSLFINSAICNKHKTNSRINKIIIYKSVMDKKDIYNQSDCIYTKIEEFIFGECYIDRIIINDDSYDDYGEMYIEISGRYVNE